MHTTSARRSLDDDKVHLLSNCSILKSIRPYIDLSQNRFELSYWEIARQNSTSTFRDIPNMKICVPDSSLHTGEAVQRYRIDHTSRPHYYNYARKEKGEGEGNLKGCCPYVARAQVHGHHHMPRLQETTLMPTRAWRMCIAPCMSAP